MDAAPTRLTLDSVDAAAALGMSLKHLQSLTCGGKVPYVDLGDGRPRYLLEDLRDWIIRQRRPEVPHD